MRLRWSHTIGISLAFAAVTACRAGVAQNQAAPAPKSWTDRITIKGYIQLDAYFPQGNSAQGTTSNFRIRRARPTINVQIDPLTRVQLQFCLSTGKQSGGAGSLQTTDTYAERKIPGFGFVRAGQQVIPFGLEIYEDNAAVRSPLELSYAAESFALWERDIGIFALSEEQQRLLWQAAVVNGQGWRTADSNANKTFIGRLAYRFCPAFQLGASGLAGTYRIGTTDYQRNVVGVEVASRATKAASLEGEFYNVQFVNTLAAGAVPARYSGGYLLAQTFIGALKSYPFLRYQRTYGDLDYRSVDLGWRYQYTSTQRVTLEYDIVNGHQRDFFGSRWQLNF